MDVFLILTQFLASYVLSVRINEYILLQWQADSFVRTAYVIALGSTVHVELPTMYNEQVIVI